MYHEILNPIRAIYIAAGQRENRISRSTKRITRSRHGLTLEIAFSAHNPAAAFIVFDHRRNYTKRIRLLIIQRETGRRGDLSSYSFFPRNVGEIDFNKSGRSSRLITFPVSLSSRSSLTIAESRDRFELRASSFARECQ